MISGILLDYITHSPLFGLATNTASILALLFLEFPPACSVPYGLEPMENGKSSLCFCRPWELECIKVILWILYAWFVCYAFAYCSMPVVGPFRLVPSVRFDPVNLKLYYKISVHIKNRILELKVCTEILSHFRVCFCMCLNGEGSRKDVD